MGCSMVECGLYVLRDSYFTDFPDPHLMHNKRGRPFYYYVKDKDGLLWLIPISSQVEKYKEWIAKIEKRQGRGNCIKFHIGMAIGKERAFCIYNMFPVTEKYIEREFMSVGVHYVVRDEKLNRQLRSKALRFLKLVEDGKIRPPIDLQAIKGKLLK